MRVHFDWHMNGANQHGTQKKGEPWNMGTVTGPKLAVVKTTVEPPSSGWRFIFYFPSGKWFGFDVFFDRRARPQRTGWKAP